MSEWPPSRSVGGRGAEIFATAGSPRSASFCEAGSRARLDLRSLSFADDLRTLTGGHGVDLLAPNSLCGEAMRPDWKRWRSTAGFSTLSVPDHAAENGLELKLFQRNVAYFAVDLDSVVRQRPRAGRGTVPGLDA